jgi:hypothetical protein
MNIKRVVIIACSVFLGLVALAVCVSARFSLSNITSDFYAFIFNFFDQWSLALSAAGTIILAISVFAFIYENRRREEQEKQQVIHALHNEIHWNLRPIITLRFNISEWSKRSKGIFIETIATEPEGLYRQLETRVFDDMRSRGQLHWLEELRTDVIFCYSLIDIYNLDRHFKPEHLELLTKLHEHLDKAIRALEAKFKFLPLYMRYEDAEGTTEKVTKETSYLSKQGKSDNVLESNLNNQEPISFKPLPWGVMLFSLWASVRSAIENPSLLIQVIEWFFLVVSGICFLAVIAKLFPSLHGAIMQRVPRLNKILTNQNASWFFVPLVLLATLIGFPTNIILNWSKLQVIDLSISVVGLVCWMVAYIFVFIAMVSQIGKRGRIIGGIASVIIIGSAINAFQSNVLAGCILLGIGVVSIIIVIKPPKRIWHFQEVV